MAKTKAVQPHKDAQVKSLSSVKQGAVTKPSQTPKSKSKDIAKEVAVKADKLSKEEKKSKKTKKEPSPEPSPSASDEDDSADDSDSSASSASSDDSEAEVPSTKAAAKTNGLKTNGVGKVAPNAESGEEESESSESSASSDDDMEEPSAPKSAPAAAVNYAVAGAKEESESEEDSDEDSSEDDEESPNKGPVDAKALNGKLEEVASKEVCKRMTATSTLVITDLYRFLPMKNRAAMTPRLAHLRDHLMKRAKRKTAKRKRTRRLLLQLLRSARPKLRPTLFLRRPRPSPWVTRLPRETFSLDGFRIMSTKNGSLASSRASGNYLQFESLLIVILAAPKGKSTSVIIV